MAGAFGKGYDRSSIRTFSIFNASTFSPGEPVFNLAHKMR
jgi:hypothetical protein